MKSSLKKLLAFIFGSVVGSSLMLLGLLWSTMPSFLFLIFGFPAIVGFVMSEIILWPICKLDTTNICRGLGLDGGPLEWIEWIGVIGGMLIGYGLIFLLMYHFYLKKNKKTGKL